MTSIRRVVLVLLAAAIGACGGDRIERIRTPDGVPGYSMNCRDPARCYEEAGGLCPDGHDIRNPRRSGETPEDDVFIKRTTALVTCRRDEDAP